MNELRHMGMEGRVENGRVFCQGVPGDIPRLDLKSAHRGQGGAAGDLSGGNV